MGHDGDVHDESIIIHCGWRSTLRTKSFDSRWQVDLNT